MAYDLTLTASETYVNVGDTITLTANMTKVYIYKDGVQIGYTGDTKTTYNYIADTVGTFAFYGDNSRGSISNTVTITVNDEVVAPTIIGNLNIGNKDVKSLSINNKKVYSIVRSSDDAVLYQLTELSTNLTINVPLSLVYSDDFNITGVLTDMNNQVLASQTVKLKVGNTVVDTATTNNNGEYSFTETPVSTGNHSFQVIFDGTDVYSSCESSVVSRTIGKETTVININNISTQHEGDDVYIGGVLVSDDGEPIANATIYFSKDNVSQGSVTTNANGVFTKTITGHHN